MASVEFNPVELSGIVGDVMAKEVVAVLPNVSAAEAVGQLSSSGVRHAIVVDAERRVLGVVSQRDIFAHFIDSLNENAATNEAKKTDWAPWEIGSLIQKTPVTILPDVLLAKAGLVLANYKIDCLPVVDENKCLIGSLGITEVLRHITGKLDTELEEEFMFFTPEKKARPQIPAYFRRANGALVIPISSLEDPTCLPHFAILGYEPSTGRIAVKFVADKSEDGARKIQKDNGNLVIPADDFVAGYEIKLHVSAFDITRHHKLNCLILSPKQPTPGTAPQAAVAEAKK